MGGATLIGQDQAPVFTKPEERRWPDAWGVIRKMENQPQKVTEPDASQKA